MTPGALRLATRADNSALLELFSAVPMRGELVLSTRRDPDFFALYDMQRGVSESWAYDRTGEILGHGAVLVRDGWLDGQPARVGYLGDLRSNFAAGRERVVVRSYGEVIHDAVARHKCQRFLTAVIASNAGALAALVRRRSERETQPVYTLFRRFDMVSIQFAGPRRRYIGDFKARRATAADVPALVALLDRDHRSRPFGYRYDLGEFEHRLTHWPGRTLENTYVAVDRDGRVVGVTSVWDPAAVKRYRVLAYRGSMRWTRVAWDLAAPLLGAPRLPAPGEDFRTFYLCDTSIEGDRPEILRALLERIYADFRASGHHFFSVCVYEGDPLAPAVRGFFTRRLAFHLYVVTPAGAPLAALPPGRAGFEMALG